MTHKSKIKELVGRGLNSYHSKALKQIDRIEKKNKEQNYKIGNLVNELDNDYITKSEEGSVISLEHSKEGIVYIDELEGNTLVNYCADGAKELTLNDEIDTEGINVTLNNTIDNGIVDVSLEGNTMVNICDQKEPVAITKSYTVEDGGNHIPLQGEYNGKCRPNLYGQTMVNVCSQKEPVAITKSYTVENSGNHIALQGEYDGKCRPNIYGQTLVNLWDYKNLTDGYYVHSGSDTFTNFFTTNVHMIKPNTDYTIICNVIENTLPTDSAICVINDDDGSSCFTYRYSIRGSQTGTFKFLITSKSDLSNMNYVCRSYIHNVTNVASRVKLNCILLEGDYTNKPTPQYFEGLKSSFEDNLVTDVNNPNYGKYKVEYKVTGKNKAGDITPANGNSNDNHWIVTDNNNGTYTVKGDGYSGSSNGFALKLHANVKPNTTYTFTYKVDGADWNEGSPIFIYRDFYSLWDKTRFIIASQQTSTITFTTPSDVDKICIGFHYGRLSDATERIISNIQLEEGTVATEYEPYKEYTKTFYLNSPLLEGDTIEDINGKATHIKRSKKLILNGDSSLVWTSSQGNTSSYNTSLYYATPVGKKQSGNLICDKFKGINSYTIDEEGVFSGKDINIRIDKTKLIEDNIDGFKDWLQQNQPTVVYELASPQYEIISEESILCDSYTNGHLDFDSVVPIQKVDFKQRNFILKYLTTNTDYIVQFESDNVGKLDALTINNDGYGFGSNLEVKKGVNRFPIHTRVDSIVNERINLYGIGFNASNIQVVATDKEFDYFEGLSSSFEDQLVTDVNDPNYGKYKVEYKSTGKNKFNINNVGILNGVKNYSIDNNSISIPFTQFYQDVRYFIPVKRGATYYISYSERTDATILLYKNKVPYGHDTDCYISNVNNSNEPIKIVVDNYDMITLRISSETRDSGIMVVSNIMVRESTSDLYEPYKESTKTFYLNSPLLEGDTIEDRNGRATHVKRYEKVVLDGSENWDNYSIAVGSDILTIGFRVITNNIKNYTLSLCDKFPTSVDTKGNNLIYTIDKEQLNCYNDRIYIRISKSKLTTLDINGFKQWLSENPTTVVYELASPKYEVISNDSTLCDSYIGGHLDFDSAVPVKKVRFPHWSTSLKYLKPSTTYTIQFESDNVGIINHAYLTYYSNKSNIPVSKGVNKFTITTTSDSSKVNNNFDLRGEGFNASNMSVVETDKEFGYFEGMKSVGECEGNKIEIVSQSNNLFNGKWLPVNINIDTGQEHPSSAECFSDYINVSGLERVYGRVYNYNGNATYFKCRYYDANFKYLKGEAFHFNGQYNNYITLDKNIHYIRISIYAESINVANTTNVMISPNNPAGYAPYQLNTKEISLNEPLRGLPSGVKDRFIKQGGKWYVERNTKEVTINPNTISKEVTGVSGKSRWLIYANTSVGNVPQREIHSIANNYPVIQSLYTWGTEGFKDGVCQNASANRLFLYLEKYSDGTENSLNLLKQDLTQNPLKVVYETTSPTYEEITDAELITYLDTTHISNNSTIPCNMKVTNTGYNAIIKPSTQYTVAFDTNKSGEVGINLAGSKVTTINNVATITTPSTLVDDSLRLYGKGIKASKVRLLEGDKTNWIPSHFEGMKSCFEDKLQDDGTFKMEILSNNKNLINAPNMSCTPSSNGGWWNLEGNNNSMYNNIDKKTNLYFYAEKGKRYIISFDSKNLEVVQRLAYQSQENMLSLSTVSKQDGKCVLSMVGDGRFSTFRFRAKVEDGSTPLEITDFMIIEESLYSNEFVKNEHNKIQFSSIEPLRELDRFVFKDNQLMIERNSQKLILNGQGYNDDFFVNYHSKEGKYIRFIFDNKNLKAFDTTIKCSKLPTLSDGNFTQENIQPRGTLDRSAFYLVLDNSKVTNTTDLNEFLRNNPLEILSKKAEPTYEEIPFELQKTILEGYESGTLFFDTNIPPTSTVTYAGETPIVKATRLNKTEVLKNTDDINDNIVPYLMDMDFRVVCLQLEGGTENISMAKLFGGTYEMLQRDIQSKRYSVDEYKYRLEAYLSANKITQDEYEKLGGMLNE